MTISVNIGEAKARLSELVAASVRGEEVVLSRAGVPQARIVPVQAATDARLERLREKRRKAFGMFEGRFEGADLSLTAFQNLYPDYANDPEPLARRAD